MHILATILLAAQAAQGNPLDPAGMTFDVEGEEGVERTSFGEDGSFTDYFEGEVPNTGTYEMRDNGELCFTYEAAPEPVCWTMEGPPDAEGWATSVRVSDGLRIRVRPVFDTPEK